MIFLDNSRSCNKLPKTIFHFVNCIENLARRICAALVRETERRPRARAGRAPQAGPQLQRGCRADSTRAFCRKRRCRAARWRPQYTMELRGDHPEVESVAEWPRGRLGYRHGPSVAAAPLSAVTVAVWRAVTAAPSVGRRVSASKSAAPSVLLFCLRDGIWSLAHVISRAPCGRQLLVFADRVKCR